MHVTGSDNVCDWVSQRMSLGVTMHVTESDNACDWE